MKKFQKIKSYDSELAFENHLKDRGSEVQTVESGHHIVVTEKVDGSNAQITNHFGELKAFSHHKELDEHENSLNGFFQFAMTHNEFKKLPDNLSIFGEWLTPHKLKYKPENYKKFYVFDVFDFDTQEYWGYMRAKEIYDDILSEYVDVEMAPLLEDSVDLNMSQLENLKTSYSQKSQLSLTGSMEGIVVSDLSIHVDIDESSRGPLRIKLVNESFKETSKQKSNTPDQLFNWLAENVTIPRVRKQMFSLQEDGEIPLNPEFSWIQNGIAKKIAMESILDAITESNSLPDPINQIIKYSTKQANKFVALSVKGLI